jgi:hypothetical protein
MGHIHPGAVELQRIDAIATFNRASLDRAFVIRMDCRRVIVDSFSA